LKDIESAKTDKPKTLTITLHFSPNQFFTNDNLWIKISYKNEGDEVLKTEGSVINWKDGKDVTKKKVKKK